MTSDPAEPDGDLWARTTAPQSEFSMRQVGTGALVLLVGLLVAFGLPLIGS